MREFPHIAENFKNVIFEARFLQWLQPHLCRPQKQDSKKQVMCSWLVRGRNCTHAVRRRMRAWPPLLPRKRGRTRPRPSVPSQRPADAASAHNQPPRAECLSAAAADHSRCLNVRPRTNTAEKKNLTRHKNIPAETTKSWTRLTNNQPG